MAKTGLGKGLGALIKQAPNTSSTTNQNGETVQYLSITDVVPSPQNPRSNFSKKEITELASSISEHGIIQPLIVRKVGQKFELIAGERRWRASQELKLTSVPCIVRTASDREVLEMALIENLQRQDLDPIEESSGYVKLAKEFKLTQDEIAKRVGKSRASVANTMRLLDLPEKIQALVSASSLSVGHAKVILSVKGEDEQIAIADQAVQKKLTVRQTEKVIAEQQDGVTKRTKKEVKEAQVPEKLLNAQEKLADQLKTKVLISGSEKRGKIELEFKGAGDFERILALIS